MLTEQIVCQVLSSKISFRKSYQYGDKLLVITEKVFIKFRLEMVFYKAALTT